MAPAPALTAQPAGTVRAVTDDGVMILEDDRRVWLVGVRMPSRTDLPPDAGSDEAARVTAYAGAALSWLRARATGQVVALWSPAMARDRYGRELAHCVAGTETAQALWLQAGLIDAGLARVETMPGADAGASPLLLREAKARLAGLGLWRDPLYRPRAPGETWPWLGTFQIVRGTVRAAAKVRGRVYLNFGADWRRDFTVMVDRPGRAGFKVGDLLDLRRQYIQVRGWLFPTNGPMIALDHPTSLESTVILG